MKILNFAADRDIYVQEREGLVMPAVHGWRDLIARNALILERTELDRGSLEQRDLRRNEEDVILGNYRRHGLTAGNVVIKTLYAGICGSDVKNAFSERCAYTYKPGRALLHEACGVIVAVGDGVHGYEVGDLVVANPLLLSDNCYDGIAGELRRNRTTPFCSIQTHGFGQEAFIHPASHIVKVDPTKIGPRVATLAEPFACAHSAVERRGELTERVARRRQLFPEAEYGHYNFSVVILGAGGLGLTTAVLAKYRGADTVIVLDNNPEKVARVRSLGEGFYGVCTDWIKKSGPRLDRARLDDVHEQVRSLCRTPLMRTKGADMLLNCVSQPSAALLHHRVLSGSLEPIIVQAGGSHGPIEWDEDTNREFMTCEATIALAYRYTQADLEAAVDCISAIPHQVGHLVSSIRESSEHQFTGAQMALREAHSDGSTAGKLLVAYTNKRHHHDVVQNVTKVP